MRPADRTIAAALCRSTAFMGEHRITPPIMPWEARSIVAQAVRGVFGTVAFSPLTLISPDEAILLLCLAACVLEDASA